MNSTAKTNTVVMRKIFLAGFAPFDGRAQNASWIAASALAATNPQLDLRAVLIPVCWGAPKQVLTPLVSRHQPDCIIGMGEGEPGVFRLETIARNVRRERVDNEGRYPDGECIECNGPELRIASADCKGLHAALSAQGVPVQLSDDAGAFLCEEMLYTLESLRENHESLQSVLFIHLPPYGTDLLYRGQLGPCDETLLLDFGLRLLSCICNHEHLTGFTQALR